MPVLVAILGLGLLVILLVLASPRIASVAFVVGSVVALLTDADLRTWVATWAPALLLIGVVGLLAASAFFSSKSSRYGNILHSRAIRSAPYRGAWRLLEGDRLEQSDTYELPAAYEGISDETMASRGWPVERIVNNQRVVVSRDVTILSRRRWRTVDEVIVEIPWPAVASEYMGPGPGSIVTLDAPPRTVLWTMPASIAERSGGGREKRTIPVPDDLGAVTNIHLGIAAPLMRAALLAPLLTLSRGKLLPFLATGVASYLLGLALKAVTETT